MCIHNIIVLYCAVLYYVILSSSSRWSLASESRSSRVRACYILQSMYVYISLSIYIYIYTYVYHISLSIYLSLCIYIYIYISIYRSYYKLTY